LIILCENLSIIIDRTKCRKSVNLNNRASIDKMQKTKKVAKEVIDFASFLTIYRERFGFAKWKCRESGVRVKECDGTHSE